MKARAEAIVASQRPRPPRAQAGPRRHPRRGVLRPAPATGPRRPRSGPPAAGHAWRASPSSPTPGTWRRRTRPRSRSRTGSCVPSSTACSSSRRRRSTPCPPTGSRGTGWRGCSASGDGRRRRPASASTPSWPIIRPRPGDPRAALLQAAARGLRRRAGPGGTDRQQRPASPPDAVEERLAAFGFVDADRTRQALERAHAGPDPILEAHAAAASAPARLAVRVARPRPGPRRPPDARRRPAPARSARHGLPGVARARPAALPAARDEPAPGRDHRPPPRLRDPPRRRRPPSPRRSRASSSKRP